MSKVLIVGGGAAGMFASVWAARNGHEVLLFEKNDRLEEAKEILHLALDRAPVGKRLLYKLTELAVRTGSLDEAEDYYYEFRAVDPEDIGNYVLQYMILKARHAPYDRQLQPLELFCQADPDEK